jgi:hypothetical protein
MGRFNGRTVEELRTHGVGVEHPVPGLMLLDRGDGHRLLVSALSLLGPAGEGVELFEEDRLAAGEDKASLGAYEGAVLHAGRLWRPVEGGPCPDSVEDLTAALRAKPRRRAGDLPAPTLAVLSLLGDPPGEGERLALWLSRGEDAAVRPLGFVGGERRPTALRAPLCDERGAAVIGDVLVSAHVVEEGGRVAWRLPLRIRAEEGGDA